MDVQYSTNEYITISVINKSNIIPVKKQNIRIKYILIMAKETEREEIKEQTHELEDEEKDELGDEENEEA